MIIKVINNEYEIEDISLPVEFRLKDNQITSINKKSTLLEYAFNLKKNYNGIYYSENNDNVKIYIIDNIIICKFLKFVDDKTLLNVKIYKSY